MCFNAYSIPLTIYFLALTAAFLATRFSKPFHIHAKENLAKKENNFCSPQGLNSHPFNHKASEQPIQPIYTFVNPIKSKVK